jgi:hypothetical protein
VAAQEAIERVIYSHQLGTTRPFHVAVPRQVLEDKVRRYLAQSAALEELWHTPVTAGALRSEWKRIVRRTRLPDRLAQIYHALDDDPFLIQECFVRPVLVDRLARSFFAFDDRFHGQARAEADELLARLKAGETDARTANSRRWVQEFVVGDPELLPRREPGDGPIELSRERFTAKRARAPRHLGPADSVREDRETFTIEVLLGDGGTSFRVARHTIRKRAWTEWWQSVQGSFLVESVRPVASTTLGLPEMEKASAAATGCLPNDTWDPGGVDDALTPNERWHHTAVWTGSLMLIWGGLDPYYMLGTGARYDPLTDSWTAISVEDAPSVREFHTACGPGAR